MLFSYFKSLALFGVMAISFLLPVSAQAFEVKKVNVDVERNDFILEPAKVEIFLDAGGSEEKVLRITNRTKEDKKFSIEIEDFAGSQDPTRTVELLGEEVGPLLSERLLNS